VPQSSLETRTVTSAFGAKVSITNHLAYRFAILSRGFCAAESIDSSASVSTMEGVAAAIGSKIAGSIGIELECGSGEGGSTVAALPGARGAALPGEGGAALPGAGDAALPGAGGAALAGDGGAALPGTGDATLPGDGGAVP